MLTALFAHGRVLDAILAGVVLEALGLSALWLWRGHGVPPSRLLPNLAAGAGLLLALRLALSGAKLVLVAACLGAALAMHLLDLRQRWGARAQ